MHDERSNLFRVRPTQTNLAAYRLTIIILVAIGIATCVTVWMLLEVIKQEKALNEILRWGSAEDIKRLGELPYELPWQFVFILLVLGVLLTASGAMIFVLKEYLASNESLNEVRQFAWSILAGMDDGILTTDLQGRITSFNPRIVEFLGEAITHPNQRLAQLGNNGLDLANLCAHVRENGKPIYDFRFKENRAGHPLQLRAECHLLRGSEEEARGTAVHVRDVTEQALTEERIRRMEQFMSLGVLAAGLHHEIKNPLSALLLHVQLLEEQLLGKADESDFENITILKVEVKRIVDVLENFRDYASVDRLNSQKSDISEVIRHTVDLIGPRSQRQNVVTLTHPPAKPLPPIQVDSVRMRQALLNLSINALEAMPEGGEFHVSWKQEEDEVVIALRDTGPGIQDSIKKRIFDPYFSTKNSGSGMGLAFCDKIVRQHSGSIDLDTNPHGSTFYVKLPIRSNE
jgi:two-component system, NtrC family, sensor histidine kinase HydH